MMKSPKIGLIFQIVSNILLNFMQKLSYLSILWNLWWYSCDVRAKPILSKIKFEKADIDSNLKS